MFREPLFGLLVFVSLILNGCAFNRRHENFPIEHNKNSLLFEKLPIEKRKKIECTGTLVRIARNGIDTEKREQAFDVLEEAYPATVEIIDPTLPTESEIAFLKKTLKEATQAHVKLLNELKTENQKTIKRLTELYEKEIQFSQYKKIIQVIGIALISLFGVKLITGGLKIF